MTSAMKVEVILVPYDVERDDTSLARAPREILERGFLDALKETGCEIFQSEVWSRVEDDKSAIVTSVARETARAVAVARSRGRFPLILSGGCLTAVGVVTALQRLGRDLAILWIDAHGDFNTPESTPSGYWDGMALAAVCGRSLAAIYKEIELRPIHFGNVAHLGGRAFDPPEVEDFQRLRVTLIPPDQVCSDRSLQEIQKTTAGKREIYLHVDLDGLDPRDAPAVNLPEPNGIPLEDVLRCLEQVKRPAAMTLSGMNFERVDRKRAELTVQTCLRLVEKFLRPEEGEAETE